VGCHETLQGRVIENGTKGVREVQVRLGCTGGQMGLAVNRQPVYKVDMDRSNLKKLKEGKMRTVSGYNQKQGHQ
jgi:hypothetical protein